MTLMFGVLAAGPAFAQQRTPGAKPGTKTPPAPVTAADFAKQGSDLYKAGDFAGAVAPLERAHELEANNFDYLYTLAQALRQAGDCGKAVPHYEALVAAAPDPATARDVRTNMALCPNATPEPPPVVAAAPPPPPPPAPQVIVREGGISSTNAALLMGAGAGLGASICLFLSAHSDDSDADAARSFDDHERISSRATQLRIASVVMLGVGAGLAVLSFYRLKVPKHEQTEVGIATRPGGATLVLETSW